MVDMVNMVNMVDMNMLNRDRYVSYSAVRGPGAEVSSGAYLREQSKGLETLVSQRPQKRHVFLRDKVE